MSLLKVTYLRKMCLVYCFHELKSEIIEGHLLALDLKVTLDSLIKVLSLAASDHYRQLNSLTNCEGTIS
jgi:hypothetical protein